MNNAGPDFLNAMLAFIANPMNIPRINSLHQLFGGWEKWMQGEIIWNTNNVSALPVNYLVSQEDAVFVGNQLADFVIVNKNLPTVPHGNTKAAVIELKCKTISESLTTFRNRVLADTTKLQGSIYLPGFIPSHTIARCQMVVLSVTDTVNVNAAITLQLTQNGVAPGNIISNTTAIGPVAPGQLAQLFVQWTE